MKTFPVPLSYSAMRVSRSGLFQHLRYGCGYIIDPDFLLIASVRSWLWLAVVIVLYSRKVVEWTMSTRMKTALVKEALTMACFRRKPPRGMIHQSNRGSQLEFCSSAGTFTAPCRSRVTSFRTTVTDTPLSTAIPFIPIRLGIGLAKCCNCLICLVHLFNACRAPHPTKRYGKAGVHRRMFKPWFECKRTHRAVSINQNKSIPERSLQCTYTQTSCRST